jgi:hypothetical protein
LDGWVAFEDVAYIDMQPRAKVVLQHSADLYIPSDFAGNRGVQLKAKAPKRP